MQLDLTSRQLFNQSEVVDIEYSLEGLFWNGDIQYVENYIHLFGRGVQPTFLTSDLKSALPSVQLNSIHFIVQQQQSKKDV